VTGARPTTVETALADVVDAALEVSVVGSFSNVGIAVRRRLPGWTDPRPGALTGSTVVITGPTSGLGRAIAWGVAGLGARILLLGRDADRLESVRSELAARYEDPGQTRFQGIVVDMSSGASVDAAIRDISAGGWPVDVVIDNAGAIHERRTTTQDGLEATIATLVIQPFRLVAGLLASLRRGRHGQVIAVASGGMYAQALRLDDLESAHGAYDGVRAYARAKRAQVALIREWARRFGGEGLRFDAMHPGWADTRGLREALPRFRAVMRPLLRDAGQGADTAVWLAAGGAADRPTGQLYLDRRARPFDRVPWTRLGPSARRELWDRVVELSGIAPPASGSRPQPPGWSPASASAAERRYRFLR